MAGRRIRSSARAAGIAEQLHYECTGLLELFRKRERLPSDISVGDGRLVSVPLPSSQLEPRDRLWCLYSALLQCRALLERAVAREEEDLGSVGTGEYQTERKAVKDRLNLLLASTRELLEATGGTAALTPNLDGLEINGPTVTFELKLWIYRIFKELEYWSKTAITTLQGLPPVAAKEHARTAASRRIRSARR